MVILSILGFILPILLQVLIFVFKASLTALKVALKTSRLAIKTAQVTTNAGYTVGKAGYEIGKAGYKAGKVVKDATKAVVTDLTTEEEPDKRFGLNSTNGNMGKKAQKLAINTAKLGSMATVFAIKTAIKSVQLIISLLRVLFTTLMTANIVGLIISVFVLCMSISLIAASVSGAGVAGYSGVSVAGDDKKGDKLSKTEISGDASTWVDACKLAWDAGQAYIKENHLGGYQSAWGKTLVINNKKYVWAVNDCSGTVSLALNVFGVDFSGYTKTFADAKSIKGFKKLIVGKDITSLDLQAGDILVARGDAKLDGQALGGGSEHHVQVVVSNLSGKKGTAKTYNWGSSSCATKEQPFDSTYWYEDTVNGCIRDSSHHYKVIWRYVGD